MSADLNDMIERAAAVREHAHAPYSGFRVGACIRAESGQLYTGCNVENAAYPQGQCSEATAIGAMVSGGETRQTSSLFGLASPGRVTRRPAWLNSGGNPWQGATSGLQERRSTAGAGSRSPWMPIARVAGPEVHSS